MLSSLRPRTNTAIRERTVDHKGRIAAVTRPNWLALVLPGFHNHGNALPAADACRRQSVTQAITPQLVQNCDHQARSAGPQRMPERNRSSIHVGFVALQPSTFSTAKYCAANASFTSTRSICSSVNPASFSAFCEEGTGPIPMVLGSTPATVQDTMRPTGFNPRSLAVFSRATTTAAAPSTIPLAFPAVTMPSFLNDGGNFSRISIVVSGRR